MANSPKKISELTELTTADNSDVLPILDIDAGETKKITKAHLGIAGGGDVVGPASSTTHAIPKFTDESGKIVENTLATIDDAGSINIPTGETYKINGSAHTHSHTALTDIGTNTHAQIDTFIGTKAQASGLASLDGSSKVVQDPANATATPAASKIPIAGGAGKLAEGWLQTTDANMTDLTDGGQTTLHYHVPSFNQVSASDTLQKSLDTERSTTSATYVKKKSVRALYNGTYRIKFSIKTASAGQSAVGAVYKNGVLLGTERTNATDSYVEYSEDLAFLQNDTIEIYLKQPSAATVAYCNNFRVYYDNNIYTEPITVADS